MARQAFGEAIASRYWREEDARTVLTAWRASGLSAVEFGRRNGVSARRLLRWASVVGSGGVVERSLSFVELTNDGGAPPARRDALEIVVGGAVVRVAGGFDPALLAEVVRALRGPAC